MEESYETFEEELGPPRADPPPQKPVRQILRPEMYPTRRVREDITSKPQQPREEATISPNIQRTTTLRKAPSVQKLQTETPWENVTLNRCLFVAITILVLTSGFQRLHEAMRGPGTAEDEEEEVGLRVRRFGTLRHRSPPPEPETTLWEVMFWWLPDLDDDDDEDDEEDDDGRARGVKSKRGSSTSRGLRNKPLPDKKLLKQRKGKFKDRRAKKSREEEIKGKKERDKKEEREATAAEEDEGEGNEQAEPEKNNKPEEKEEKKKTQKE